MGYSVRTDAFRYTVGLHWNGAKLQGDFTRPPIGAELYDHSGDTEKDFDSFENANIASDPAQKANVGKLYAMEQAHWDGKGLVEATRAAVSDANRAPLVAGEAVAMTREERALRFEEWE